MIPLVIVLAVGVILHTIVGVATHAPDEEQTTRRWKTWHTFLTGLATTALMVAVVIGYHQATGILLPFWALVLAVDVFTLGWKLWRHRQRLLERRLLQALFDRPSLGEGA